jgi:hypothetical protein
MTAPTKVHMNPDILDATGALGCAQGAGVYVLGAKAQMNKLALRAEAGLRSTSAPIVGQIRKFEAGIGATQVSVELLIKEHVRHVVTQDRLAKDPNLHHAATGYLDALRRGGIGGANTLAPASGSVGAAGAPMGWTIDGNIRGPKQAERNMIACADSLGIGTASTLRALRSRLVDILGVAADSESPILLTKVDGQLQALCRLGHACAAEFARQVAEARRLVANDKALAGTQNGGWLDPKNLH